MTATLGCYEVMKYDGNHILSVHTRMGSDHDTLVFVIEAGGFLPAVGIMCR